MIVWKLLNRCTGGSDGGIEEFGLPRDYHASLSSKLKVCCCGTGVNFADEFARGIVNPDAVARTGIDAAFRIGMYSWFQYQV